MTSTPRKISDISIIIPTLNEQANIEPLVQNIGNKKCEVIIVDGGSSDDTVMLARKHGLKVIEAEPGRAGQLNRGAAEAQGKILLFLHADTRLPQNFAAAVRRATADTTTSAGAFRLAIEDPTPAMRFISGCANLRSSLLQMPYGNQAIFVKKDLFRLLGMFPELPIMEDYLFIQKAKRKGKIVLVEEEVTTSARRWQRMGVWRTTVINQLIILGYYLRIPLEKLALFYRR